MPDDPYVHYVSGKFGTLTDCCGRPRLDIEYYSEKITDSAGKVTCPMYRPAKAAELDDNEDSTSLISEVASPDAPTITNEKGAKQSHIPVAFHLVDGGAMFEMAKVLHEGAEKYGANNWRGIPVEEHLNHLIMHVYAYLSGDRTDEHLSHIMCRAMFAQAVELAPSEEDSSEAAGYHYTLDPMLRPPDAPPLVWNRSHLAASALGAVKEKAVYGFFGTCKGCWYPRALNANERCAECTDAAAKREEERIKRTPISVKFGGDLVGKRHVSSYAEITNTKRTRKGSFVMADGVWREVYPDSNGCIEVLP